MIVNPTLTGWQIICQQAHALLAAQLAWACPPFLPPSRWVGLLAATAQHDDEQAAWHGRGGHHGLTPAGAPANFTQRDFSLEQAQGLLHAARFQGRWCSLLTSLHLSCLRAAAGQCARRHGLPRRAAGQPAALGPGPGHYARRGPPRLRPAALVRPALAHPLPPGAARDGPRSENQPAAGRPRAPASYVRQPGGPGAPVVVRPWPFAADALAVSVEAVELR
ncbi:MAG: DUF3891 family protein [Janthinobacterium lividum]